MYIKSLYHFLNFKQSILFASLSLDFRNNHFHPPSRLEVYDYYKKNNTRALYAISSYFFDNNLEKMYQHYKLFYPIFHQGNIDFIRQISSINYCYDVLCKIFIGQLSIPKRSSKYIFRISPNIEFLLYMYVPIIFELDLSKNIEVLYNSIRHQLLTPKSIISYVLYKRSCPKIMKWIEKKLMKDKLWNDTYRGIIKE